MECPVCVLTLSRRILYHVTGTVKDILNGQPHYIVGTMVSVPVRGDSIFVRVFDAEKAAFKEGAALDDLTVSDWLRKLAKKRLQELGVEITKPNAHSARGKKAQ